MREVSDAFLLNLAEVSAALIGLFMVGVFFFVDTGFRRLDRARVLFVLLGRLLLAANLATAVRIRAVARVTGSTALLVNELVGSAVVVAIVALPWVLGGLHPTREDLAWAILLAFAAGFASISALVLFVLDVARFETG